MWRVLGGWLAVVAVAASAEAQSRLVLPGPDVEPLRSQLSVGSFATRGVGLTPCEPFAPIAHSSDRRARSVWAGRFRVLRPGSAGQWHLVVLDANGVERWRRPIPNAQSVDTPVLETAVVASNTIRLQIHGPGISGAVCPLVRLEEELEEVDLSKPRGIVSKDDRIKEGSADFAALSDAATIRPWAAAVVHLRALSPSGKLLPCTAFFVSANVLLTAAHCVRTAIETAGSVLFLGDQRLTGGDLTLLISQPDLDFTVLWINRETAPATLSVSPSQETTLVLWQFPSVVARLVSVEQCNVHPGAPTRVSHKCDSSVGTSGAPIQARNTGVVTALHVEGCTQTNGMASCVNHGIKMADIRARIEELAADLRTVHPQQAPQVLAAFGVNVP